MGVARVAEMSWEEFVRRFEVEFSPSIEVQRILREFQELHQTTNTVVKITAKFQEQVLLILQYPADEDMSRTRYHSNLRDDISEFLSFSGWKTLNEMVEKAQERKMELQFRTKWKPEQAHLVVA